jgi:hypothetical protein
MIIQLSIIVFVIFFALKSKIENAILAVICVLPFQYFLKNVFTAFLGSSSLISLWKEIIIIIVFLKILKRQYYYDAKVNRSFPLFFFIIIFSLELLLLLVAPVKSEAIVSFKVYCFPIITAYCCMHMAISNHFFKKLFRVILISSSLVFIISHLQLHFFSVEFAFLMDIADELSASGEVVFKYSASLIMGVERMYGCFSGPNELGLYTALVISFLSYFLLRQKMSKALYFITLIVIIFAFATIIQTFSRISWAFLGIFFLVANYKILLKRNTLIIGATVMGLFAIFFFVTDFGEIFKSSIKFEEASAEARPDDFFSGIEMVAKNPLGLGLGTVQYGAEKRLWETEIFWWLVLVENGILIGGAFFVFYISMALKMLFKKKPIASFTGTILIIAIVLGFASAIIFEPIFLTFLWALAGLALNSSKLNYSTS